MFSRSPLLRIVVLLLALAVTLPVEATELTGGTVTRTGLVGGTGFSLNGPELSYSGGFNNIWWHSIPCIPCFPGDVESLSNSVLLDTTKLSLSTKVTIDAQTYFNWGSLGGSPPFPSAIFLSEMLFTGGAVEVPVSDEPNLVLVAPFTMTGFVSGRDGFSLLFDANFSANGFGSLHVKRIEWANGSAYMFQAITYQIANRIDIDIKPGDDLNYINLRSRGKTPIAVLSTAAFDAGTMDPLTIRVAGAPVSLRENGTAAWSLKDVNGDGRIDLVIHVNTQALQLTSPNQVLLEGYSFSGDRLWGSDEIIAVEEPWRRP